MFEIFRKPEKTIQKYLSKAFVGNDTIMETDLDSGGKIQVLKTSHPDGVTYLGSIGGFLRQMQSSFFIERKLRVELIAQFTTNNYTLTANFYDLSKSELLCTGTLIKTLPDEVFFSRTIKDIIDDSEKVIFLDYNLNNLIIMNVSDIRAKCFKFSFSDCAYQDDEKAIETHKELIQYLSYNG